TRSFCYISDMVEGIYRLMISDYNEPVNLGNPHEMTIQQMAEKVIAMTGSSSQCVYESLPVDDPKVRQPNIERAKRILGWAPKVGLDEGLISTIEYFKQKLQTAP
ncbi:MAG TPA: SDR family NAD-dependent epimerase/dehydratase, partial [Acidobacteriota bacterium]